MLKFLKALTSRLNGRRPYKTKVVCESVINAGNETEPHFYGFTIYYKRFMLSKYRPVTDPNGNPMRYGTYVEAAAAAYMASITSLKFFNS